jgi:hypothetical protein
MGECLQPSADPYEAPGFSLKLAIRRERLRHADSAKASDLLDEEHIVFAPYVDVLLVDKRTYDYAQRAVARNTPPLPLNPESALRKAAQLKDVLQVMQELRKTQRNG